MSIYATAGANVGYCDIEVVAGHASAPRSWVFEDPLTAPDGPVIVIGKSSFDCEVDGNVVTVDLPAEVDVLIGQEWFMLDAEGHPVLGGEVVRWHGDGAGPATSRQVAVTDDGRGGVLVRGTTGPKGDQGNPGPPGPTAYELYVEEGGLLSLEDWLEAGFATELGTAAENDMVTERGPLTLFASDSFGTAPFGTLTGRTWDDQLGGAGTLVWGAPVGSGSWRAISLGSEASSAGPPGQARRNTGGSGAVFHGTDFGTADARVEARWSATGAGTYNLVARYNAIDDSYYGARINATTGTIDLVRKSGGTTVALAAAHTGITVPKRVAVDCDGSTIKLLLDGVVVDTVADIVLAGDTWFGFRDSGTNTTFAFGDIWAYTYPTVPAGGPVPNIDYVDGAIATAIDGLPTPDASTVDTLLGPALDPIPTESEGNPIALGAAHTYGTIFYPSLVHLGAHLSAEELDALDLDEWAVYYSTDHDDDGGIAMLTGPSPAGPWTDVGQIYIDDTAGSDSTETPAVIYDETAGLWRMFYQQRGVDGAVANQTTNQITSTSPTFTSPTELGVVLDLPDIVSFPGGLHTGYFKPWRIGTAWYGYSLSGASGPSGMSRGFLWHSPDGVTWAPDPRPLGGGVDHLEPGFRMAWSGSRVLHARGHLWWIGRIAAGPGGGPGEGAVKHIVVAPMAPTFRNLIGAPRVVLSGDDDAGWVGADLRSFDAAVGPDGRLHIVYGDGVDLGHATTEVL